MNKCEAAEFLGMRLADLEKLMRRKQIPYISLDLRGRKALFKKSELVKWAREKKFGRLK